MKAWSADDESSSRPRRREATAGSILDDSDSDNENAGYSCIDDKMSAELNTYRCSKVEPISSDPLEYWKSKQPVFPNIALQAQKLLCIPATFVPCERLFSTGGEVVSRRWASVRPDHVRELLCLPSWLK